MGFKKYSIDIIGVLVILMGAIGMFVGAWMIHPGLMVLLLGWVAFNIGQQILKNNDPFLNLRAKLNF